ncbi:MAG: polyphosphate polymerase domain-containing protein [Deltaproteobacteria bacterium]|nr:polyphosphate polymerase domain-containing protein [Deltaproteobacteria bacterium]
MFKGRHELKYVVPVHEGDAVLEALRDHLQPDPHGDEQGSYEVASIYYDTPSYRFYWDRTESVGYRRKVRLRAYLKGQGISALFIEIKERHRSLVVKKRISLPLALLDKLGPDHFHWTLPQILEHVGDSADSRELRYLTERLGLEAAANIRYLRRSYTSPYVNDLRITLDRHLTVGESPLTEFEEGSEQLFLPPDKAIFEVKLNQRAPDWLLRGLAPFGFMRQRYSKYCEGLTLLQQSFLPPQTIRHILERGAELKTANAGRQ